MLVHSQKISQQKVHYFDEEKNKEIFTLHNYLYVIRQNFHIRPVQQFGFAATGIY
jgi:hypothetical protein